ncbi:hypothetical protein BDB01DRAFT_66165 [Pilobolus umbonatus]|nr:hypothetical protein BDB01DRAFT_66165 [Pilobolus umbonatus]
MEGYNSTILAYGQTGSGKTYSMGIGLDSIKNPANEGIVPRFIDSLFQGLLTKQSPYYSSQVFVSFLELHNEDIVDLLSPVRRDGLNLTIREDTHGNICWSGVREELVKSPEELIGLLQKGSISRTTASTDMNSSSSRSHAIFSIILKQQYLSSDTPDSPDSPSLLEARKLVSKFHFVDLAGSERLKRTNAVGDRAKEGISINTGLLALGNVISALGDESRRVSHIPYRDSKLTRLLQDSLGGNSQTLMLACASPAESNQTETINTLKYANRARNIRNRVTINQEIAETDRLKNIITQLREEVRSTDDYLRAVNDEMDSLKVEVESTNKTLNQTIIELSHVKYERDRLKHQLIKIQNNTDTDHLEREDETLVPSYMVTEYTQTIEMLRVELSKAQEKLRMMEQQSSFLLNEKKHIPLSQSILDHDYSSATLVATPCQSMMLVKKINPTDIISEKLDKKKKRHRFNNKRTKSNRRRSSSINSTSSSKQVRSADLKGLVSTKILKEVKKNIRNEAEFTQTKHLSVANMDYELNKAWNEPEDLTHIVPELKGLKYRRRTIDVTPMRPSADNEHMIENKKLLQRLSSVIESKNNVTKQLERSEQLKEKLVQQFNKKISDLTHKKSNNSAQHKREISDIRNQYECRLKKQQIESQSLRRKHMQLMSKTDIMRNQTQSMIDQLNRNIEKLSHEKKKMIKRMKQESDRSKERLTESEREVTKLKRQETQLVSAKKRVERELIQQKIASKRLTEEIVALNSQLKQIATILKRVILNHGKANVNNNQLVDKALLAKAAACANVRGYVIKQNITKKTGGNFKVCSLQQHVYQKKRLIHKAISLYVKGQTAGQMIVELTQKRDRLVEEQEELLKERDVILSDSVDNLQPQYMDERIDLITIQVYALNQQIKRLQEKNIDTKDDNNNWMDEVDKELQIGVFDNANTQISYEMALTLIRSLEPEEARLVAESLMEDIVQLKTRDQCCTVSLEHSSSMIQCLQLGLVQMRRAFELMSREGEMNASVTIKAAFNRCIASILDNIFIRSLRNSVQIQNGIVLPLEAEIQEEVALSLVSPREPSKSGLPVFVNRCLPRTESKLGLISIANT